MTAEVLPPDVACATRGTHQATRFLLMKDPVVLEVAHVLTQAV